MNVLCSDVFCKMSSLQGVYFGSEVYVVNPQRRFILSKSVPLSEDFRKEMQQWLDSFFGVTNLLADGEVIAIGEAPSTKFFVNQKTFSNFNLKFNAESEL